MANDMGLRATFYDSDAGEVGLREIAFGFRPNVYIEPEMDDEENVTFNVTATDCDRESLAQYLEAVILVLREGE